MFLGFGGVAVVIAANGAGGAFPPWTIAVVVLAGLSWAFGSWYQPRLRLPGDPFVVVVYEMLVGGGVLTILGLASGEEFHPLNYSARSWVAWAYLAGFGSVVAFCAYVWMLQSAAVSLAATYAYVNPLVAPGILDGRHPYRPYWRPHAETAGHTPYRYVSCSTETTSCFSRTQTA